METTKVRRIDVERELTRARGSRKLLPWAALTAVAGAALAFVAGGSVRAAATVGVAGLFFALFAWTTSFARCPACGARLSPRDRRPIPGARKGPAIVEVPERCPRCGARFE